MASKQSDDLFNSDCSSSSTRIKSANGTVIDESFESAEEDINSSSDDADNSSDIVPLKKKHRNKVLVIDSDSEADSNTDPTVNIDEQSDSSSSHTEQSIEDETESEDQTGSDDEDEIGPEDQTGSEYLPVSEYDQPGSDVPTKKTLNSTTKISGTENLPSDRKAARVSENFHFNPDEILNSTTVHQTAVKKPLNWRLSTAYQIGEISGESSDDCEIIDGSTDIIEISETENMKPPLQKPLIRKLGRSPRQQTLDPFVKVEYPVITPLTSKVSQNFPVKQQVSRAAYEAQKAQVQNAESYFEKFQNMNQLDLEYLPDKGETIKCRLREAEKTYKAELAKLENMEASDEVPDGQDQGAFANVPWSMIEAGANAVVPKTFGKQALSTYNAQKAVTMDRLQQLHGALRTCPKEDEMDDDPEGLKVPLMPHQRRALAWLAFRENAKPSGGILADDMGLGKTLTIISLIVKSLAMEKEGIDSDEENQNSRGFIGKHSKYDGGSLIVCPASLINQWSGEIDRRLKRGLLSYNLYHGPKRESQARRLAEYNVVITTYSIVNNENEKQSALFQIKWRRIVLDEAHQIRNYKSQTSVACCQLSGKSRWALTGTPMHNKELDMYALLKFLRCSPFDDLQLWKRWVSDKVSGGPERLHTIISSMMLRRTKAELMEKGTLNCMPEKKWLLVKVELDKDEMKLYHKILIFSRTLFAQFLHQRAEKNQDYVDRRLSKDNGEPNHEYVKMREKLLRLNKFKNVSQHEILVLLLRLRQICCHPSLITSMLEDGIGEDDSSDEMNILEQLQKLDIEEKHEDEYMGGDQASESISQDEKLVNLKEAAKGHLRSSDAIFAEERASSKIKQMLKLLKEQVLKNGDKAIIVSQWSSFLNLISIHLKEANIEFDQLDGKVPVHKRMDMVNKFNDSSNPMGVLLLSLTAGGVGLNLVGANHLFLLDLHWNPQLENQAQDRIYRVGQSKPVFVYKFMAVDTIEERIKLLQDKKLSMTEGMLTGTRQVIQNKITIDDLVMIFGVV